MVMVHFRTRALEAISSIFIRHSYFKATFFKILIS